MRSYGKRLALLAVLVIGGLLAANSVATAAPADQQPDANEYAYWNYASGTGFGSDSQSVRFTQKAPYTFLAQLWFWNGAPNGGYIGLQTDGNRFDGSIGDTAIFSLWNATSAVPGPDAQCGQFGGEGDGYSCHAAMSINPSHWYRLTVTRGEVVGDQRAWSATVVDQTHPRTYQLGTIYLPKTGTYYMTYTANFSEYFGPAVPTCSDVPVSIADWTAPAGKPATATSFGYSDRGDCTGGTVVTHGFRHQPGVRMTMGGPQ